MYPLLAPLIVVLQMTIIMLKYLKALLILLVVGWLIVLPQFLPYPIMYLLILGTKEQKRLKALQYQLVKNLSRLQHLQNHTIALAHLSHRT